MQDYLRLARPFLVMLALVTAGRWLQGTVFAVEYEKGTGVFSIVTLTVMASLFSTAYLRRWRAWRIWRAVGFAMFLTLVAQAVVMLSTAASYLFGVQSYFNYATALNQPLGHGSPVAFGTAMAIRASGLVANTLLGGIAGALGWALGALLPANPSDSPV
jgi:hypothetical protein